MNLIKEEVLEKLAKKGFHPLEKNSTAFHESVWSDGAIYEASFGPDRRKYSILQSETNYTSDGGTVQCECLWTSEERRWGENWITEPEFLKDGWKSYDLYGRETGYRFPGYTGPYHTVNLTGGFADLWNMLVNEKALEKRIAKIKWQLQKRNADPAWQQLKETTQTLIQKGQKEEAKQLIQDYLQNEKLNQR